MSLKKTDTLELDQQNAWATLIPVANTQPLPKYPLTASSILIGRNSQCTICINDKRLSGKHCIITKEQDKITITDLSTNGTFIGDKKIGKNIMMQLNHNDDIWLLNASKVPPIETIGFKFQLQGVKEEEAKKMNEEQEKRKLQQQQKRKQQQIKKIQLAKKRQQQQKKKKQSQALSQNFAKSIKDQITCSFCYEIMSIPVAIQPCNHRFCGGCLTQLVNNKKDACIQCRKQITTAVRDAAFTSIIQDYLKSHPDEKRDPKQEQQLKNKNIFGFDPINIFEKIHGKPKIAPLKAKVQKPVPARGRSRGRGVVRASSDLSASDDDEKDKCRECVASRNGFQCSATQVHVGCHTCGKLIAQRNNPQLNQCCAICTTYYCNLYYPPCKAGTKLTLLQNKRQDCKIDAVLMRGNQFEFEHIRNYLISKKMNSKDVFDYMLNHISKDKFSYLMDKKIMKVPPLVPKEIKLKVNSAICDLCWTDLWFQMVFAYRIEIVSQLPSAIRDRPTCYWGINCRTSDHNKDHAKRYNHCVYQTRFA